MDPRVHPELAALAGSDALALPTDTATPTGNTVSFKGRGARRSGNSHRASQVSGAAEGHLSRGRARAREPGKAGLA